ncbi:MATE family efflux transporter [Primorskyibacter sp. 2E107]|uniref:MATE family efflux transporter n=1 Tax=Primorskyibacter sp. 2E107 TaxID=3403458 RepID=UPI003AF70945
MSSVNPSENRFLTAPPSRLFLTNAGPMMIVMGMNGLLTVVDAAFLGRFVGAEALAAVSGVFPVVMITIALSSLVGGGMASLLARHLGQGDTRAAMAVFAQAHRLALAVALLAMAVFWLGGAALVTALANGAPGIAQMAWTYTVILIMALPVQLWLAVHADAGRTEGRAGLMALLSMGVALANLGLNYMLIVRMGFGVAGSAWGTVLAQGLGLLVLLGLRLRSRGMLPLSGLLKARWVGDWRALLTLGAPVSLGFIGIALVSGCVIAMLRLTAGEAYAAQMAAYGIVTRIFSLTFLPIMAMALATQSIVGHNAGAGMYRRSDAALRLALVAAAFYGAAVEAGLLLMQGRAGALFVAAPEVIVQVGAILRPMVALYVFAGPVLVLALYFQAIGQPGRSAALSLIKPFALAPLLIFALGRIWGLDGLFLAFPIADAVVAGGAGWLLLTGLAQGRALGGFGTPLREDIA